MPQNQQRAYDRTSYILIVDDDNTLLKFFKIHLNKFFSKVIVVKNAKEAIETIKEKEIDLLITDINMPKVDGLQLMKKIRKHDAAIPVLIISGALLDSEKEEFINSEADGYLRKPFDVDQLHDFINHGMELRELLKKLLEFIAPKDHKHIRDIVSGNVKAEKYIKKDQEQGMEALDLVRQCAS